MWAELREESLGYPVMFPRLLDLRHWRICPSDQGRSWDPAGAEERKIYNLLIVCNRCHCDVIQAEQKIVF